MSHILIMAGGVGSRFWPASRESKPKQFLDILGTGQSLLQMTYERARTLADPEDILILTNERYAAQVSQHLPELPSANILKEPTRNNTAPCIAYAALHLEARDPEATLVVMPSDHIITKADKFKNEISRGIEFVSSHDAILTLGMQPHRPDTGYGYIYMGNEKSEGIYKVGKFTEKPDLLTAKAFIEDADYVWNAGIFLFSVKTILKAFKENSPEILRILQSENVYGTDAETEFLKEQYPKTPSISIDYAIMEKASNIYTLPVDIGWSDLGTWNSLFDYSEKDENDNVILCDKSQVRIDSSTNNLIKAPSQKKVVVKNMENMIVIDEDDVLLIWPRNEEQEIKPLRKSLPDDWNVR